MTPKGEQLTEDVLEKIVNIVPEAQEVGEGGASGNEGEGQLELVSVLIEKESLLDGNWVRVIEGGERESTRPHWAYH